MANPEHLAILKSGVSQWNAWRRGHEFGLIDLSYSDLVKADLVGADLAGVYLRGSAFKRANLRGANLSEADLYSATFHEADLRNCNLARASLRAASLYEADCTDATLAEADLQEVELMGTSLHRADLKGADLANTRFVGTYVHQADFSGATLMETIFADVDLSTAIGLGEVTHRLPSAIDHRTLMKSRSLPEAFLRGCGLADALVTFLPSLSNEPIQYYSLFISFAWSDKDFADRLHADLQNKGIRCWFAPHDMAGGRKTHEQIDQAIRLHERLLLILSPDSMKSSWVETEISKARRRERKENRQVLFPVRLCEFDALRDWECFDADTGKDSAREIREYFIPDFSTWKDHDSYQREFDKLLRDLKKAEDPKA